MNDLYCCSVLSGFQVIIDIRHRGNFNHCRTCLVFSVYIVFLCEHQVRLPTDDVSALRRWISNSCRGALLPELLTISRVSVDGSQSARAWGKCPFPECKTKTMCQLTWKADQVELTCFQKNAHHHLEMPGSRKSAQTKVADTVAHDSPLRASAVLLRRMPALRPCDQPSDKEHRRARRRFLSKLLDRRVASFDGVSAWQQRIAERAAFNSQQLSEGFLFFPLRIDDADWLPICAYTKLRQLTVPIGSCVFMSRHMVEATRAYIAAGGVRALNEGVLLGDFSWKFCWNGYALGVWSHAAQHSYSAGSTSQHLPRSEAIPAALQWAPKENIPAVAIGMVTMISVYKYVFSIDLTSWFSAVILDGHAAGLATIPVVLPPTTLLGRDLPHLERNILKNFDETRSRPRRRQKSKALEESTTGGMAGTPALHQGHKQTLSGTKLSATVQAEYAKANLRFVSLCCPTPLLESIAIESVIVHDLAHGLDQLAMYWTKELAPLNLATGLWRSVGSCNLMSGHVPGFTPSTCFQAEERCNRSLKSGIPIHAHKTSIDQATDLLQAAVLFTLFNNDNFFLSFLCVVAFGLCISLHTNTRTLMLHADKHTAYVSSDRVICVLVYESMIKAGPFQTTGLDLLCISWTRLEYIRTPETNS